MLVSPSVTPWRYRFSSTHIGPAHNPAVRKVYYDKDSFEIQDVEQYYLDLDRVTYVNSLYSIASSCELQASFTTH